MNRIPPDKARQLYSLYAYGHGVREAARLAGVNRGTSTRHHRLWLAARPHLQRAYDALWNGDCETCDAINAALPDDMVSAMMNCWLDDWCGEPVKSGWHAGYEDTPQATEAPTGEHEAPKPGQIQSEPQKA